MASAATDLNRVTVRLNSDTRQRLGYWADKRKVSLNDYLLDAINAAIGRENGDYDLPTLEQNRLNQMLDEMRANTSNLSNLERIIVAGFDSLLGLTRGDNYLLDNETGELDTP